MLTSLNEPHPLNVRAMDEGLQLLAGGAAYELLYNVDAPSDTELAALNTGPLEFALVDQPGVLLLAMRAAPEVPWGDAPLNPHAPDGRLTPPQIPQAGQRTPGRLTVTDHRTGLVRVIRSFTFTPEFSLALAEGVRLHAGAPYPGERGYERLLNSLYALYPTAETLVGGAVARCEIPAR